MKIINTIFTFVVMAMLMSWPVLAAAEYTQTAVHFNVESVVAYTLTLLDESLVTSDPTEASAPTTDLDFNSSTGNDKAVNAQVVGGTVQSEGSPIFQFDNTGTETLGLGIYLNASTPTCVALLGKPTYDAAADGATLLTVTNTTVDASILPTDGASDYYLWANFTDCGAGVTSRLLFTTGYT